MTKESLTEKGTLNKDWGRCRETHIVNLWEKSVLQRVNCQVQKPWGAAWTVADRPGSLQGGSKNRYAGEEQKLEKQEERPNPVGLADIHFYGAEKPWKDYEQRSYMVWLLFEKYHLDVILRIDYVWAGRRWVLVGRGRNHRDGLGGYYNNLGNLVTISNNPGE